MILPNHTLSVPSLVLSLSQGGSGKFIKFRKLIRKLSAHLSLSLNKIGGGSGKFIKFRKLIRKLSAHLSLSLQSGPAIII